MTYRHLLYDDNGSALAEVSYQIAYDEEAGSALSILKVTPEGYEVSQDEEEILRERAGYDDAEEARRIEDGPDGDDGRDFTPPYEP